MQWHMGIFIVTKDDMQCHGICNVKVTRADIEMGENDAV